MSIPLVFHLCPGGKFAITLYIRKVILSRSKILSFHCGFKLKTDILMKLQRLFVSWATGELICKKQIVVIQSLKAEKDNSLSVGEIGAKILYDK